jgi:hypothetical protein
VATTISRWGCASEVMIWLRRSSLLSCSGGSVGVSGSSGVAGESIEVDALAGAAFVADE